MPEQVTQAQIAAINAKIALLEARVNALTPRPVSPSIAASAGLGVAVGAVPRANPFSAVFSTIFGAGR